MKNEKKYMRLYGCTRGQYRRIINKAPYAEYLDGSWEKYNQRKMKIEESMASELVVINQQEKKKSD